MGKTSIRVKSFVLAMMMTISMIGSLSYADGQTFTDMPKTHWAYESVERAFKEGAVNGTSYDEKTGSRTYTPEKELLETEFIAIITRAFYTDDLKQVSYPTTYKKMWEDLNNIWYAQNIAVALNNNMLLGTDMKSRLVKQEAASEASNTPGNFKIYFENQKSTRYNMAVEMTNVAIWKCGYTLNQEDYNRVSKEIGDWNKIPDKYKSAVATMYCIGVIKGVNDQNEFAGDTNVTRAQAAVIYCRFSDFMKTRSV